MELVQTVYSMNHFGFFKRQPMVLCHRDLEPRNIMIQVDDNGSVRITGIIDWDLAIFASRFVACRPPYWLWRFEPGGTHAVWDWEDECDRFAAEVPEDVKAKELKTIFDQAVGQKFVSLAYPEHYRLARKLVRTVVSGWPANHCITAAEDLVKEWAPLACEISDKHDIMKRRKHRRQKRRQQRRQRQRRQLKGRRQRKQLARQLQRRQGR